MTNKNLDVWGGAMITKAGQEVRAIAAVSSMRELSELTGISRYYLNRYWCKTGNRDEIELANLTPHKIIYRSKVGA